jgi:hypothetical protein
MALLLKTATRSPLKSGENFLSDSALVQRIDLTIKLIYLRKSSVGTLQRY